MKLIKIFLFTILLGVGISNHNFSTVHAYARQNNGDELSIALLHPHIERAIADHYGYARRYEIGDSDLEILQRNGNIFTVKVTVDTFEGAHNDYYTEIITFTVTPSEVTLKNYTHNEFIP